MGTQPSRRQSRNTKAAPTSSRLHTTRLRMPSQHQHAHTPVGRTQHRTNRLTFTLEWIAPVDRSRGHHQWQADETGDAEHGEFP